MFFTRIVCAIFILGVALYAYIDQNNHLTQLRISIPILEKQLKLLTFENTRLQFEIEKFENPINLIQLSRKPQFSYLKQPLISDIIYFRSEMVDSNEKFYSHINQETTDNVLVFPSRVNGITAKSNNLQDRLLNLSNKILRSDANQNFLKNKNFSPEESLPK